MALGSAKGKKRIPKALFSVLKKSSLVKSPRKELKSKKKGFKSNESGTFGAKDISLEKGKKRAEIKSAKEMSQEELAKIPPMEVVEEKHCWLDEAAEKMSDSDLNEVKKTIDKAMAATNKAARAFNRATGRSPPGSSTEMVPVQKKPIVKSEEDKKWEERERESIFDINQDDEWYVVGLSEEGLREKNRKELEEEQKRATREAFRQKPPQVDWKDSPVVTGQKSQVVNKYNVSQPKNAGEKKKHWWQFWK